MRETIKVLENVISAHRKKKCDCKIRSENDATINQGMLAASRGWKRQRRDSSHKLKKEPILLIS